MDISSYIASGILEAYVLGEVSPQEAREVSCLSSIYPEIQTELESLEKGMEGLAMSFSKEPPAALKSNIMAALDALELPEEDDEAVVAPVSIPEEAPLETVVKPMFSRWYVQAAAAAVLLLGGLFLGQQMLKPQITALEGSVAELQQNTSDLESQLATRTEQIALLTTPKSKIVDLEEVKPTADEASMRVLWQPETGDAYFLATTLDELPSDKDYQLWALVDGNPVDLGVVPRDGDAVVKMKNIGRVDAFAVTIEPRGGSVSPTLEQLTLMKELG